ncbi:MAG: (d)CMP kinase [bacterium]
MSGNEQLNVIAIDGPAGSGKSTVAKRTARRLDWTYVDTGAMYRCLCLKALRNDISTDDTDGLVRALDASEIEMSFESGELTVRLDYEDVSEAIRKTQVDEAVSDVAAHKEVREKMVDMQRRMGERGEAVVEGRDIGTVVFPDAEHKFFLDAPLDVRARRRYNQLVDSGHTEITYQAVLDDMQQRDETDRERSAGPLKPPDDAIMIDTTDPSAEEVVNRIIQTLGKDS